MPNDDQRLQWMETGAWHAFNTVLGWINTQDTKFISKGDLYDAVMELRPRNMPELEQTLSSRHKA